MHISYVVITIGGAVSFLVLALGALITTLGYHQHW
jgi:hypothetical protein